MKIGSLYETCIAPFIFEPHCQESIGREPMQDQTPRSRTVESFSTGREHRGFRGIIGAALVSLALWSFLMMAVLGLIFKILS